MQAPGKHGGEENKERRGDRAQQRREPVDAVPHNLGDAVKEHRSVCFDVLDHHRDGVTDWIL